MNVSSRDRVFHHTHHGCDEWEHNTYRQLSIPRGTPLKAKLPEGTEWKFYKVFPCLLNGHEKPPSVKREGAGKLVYIAQAKGAGRAVPLRAKYTPKPAGADMKGPACPVT